MGIKIKKNIYVIVLLFVVIEVLLYLYVDLPLYLKLKERNSEVQYFFNAITDVGVSTLWLVPSFLLFLIFKYLYVRPWLASRFLFLFSSVALAGFVNLFLKMLLGRNRPIMYDWYHGAYGFDFFQHLGNNISFPSGHTNTVFAVATVMALWFPIKRYWIFAVAAVLGLSRVVLGKHYLSDVVAGAFVGTVVVLLWFEYYKKKGWTL